MYYLLFCFVVAFVFWIHVGSSHWGYGMRSSFYLLFMHSSAVVYTKVASSKFAG